jgi:cardiolipin synthase
VPLVRHAGHAWFEVLLRAGVRIHEYQSAILHAKTMVVDRFASMVGSSNLDFRSFRFNAECNVVILDEATGLSLAKTFLQDLGHSREIEAGEWSGRNLRHRCLDALAGALAPFL